MHKNNSVKCFMSPFYAVCCVFTHSFTSPATFSFIAVYKDDAVSNSECCWKKNRETMESHRVNYKAPGKWKPLWHMHQQPKKWRENAMLASSEWSEHANICCISHTPIRENLNAKTTITTIVVEYLPPSFRSAQTIWYGAVRFFRSLSLFLHRQLYSLFFAISIKATKTIWMHIASNMLPTRDQ